MEAFSPVRPCIAPCARTDTIPLHSSTNAREQGHEEAVKFFGIPVEDEKDIIIIFTNQKKKAAVMRAIRESQGIIFVLPVDNMLGLDFE